MVWFIYIGTAMTLAGLVGIVMFIRGALRLRKGSLSDDVMRAELQKLVPLNLGSFLLSALGLMCVVLGVILA